MPESSVSIAKAEARIRRAAVAAVVAAVITLVIWLTAMMTEATGSLSFFNDPWLGVDVVLMFALALGIWRKSRVASALLITYYVVCRIFLWTEWRTPGVLGILGTCVFLYLFVTGFVGSISYHRLRRKSDPTYRTFRRWMLFVWCPVGALLILFLGGVLFIGPPTGVVQGTALRESQRKFLRDSGILGTDENVDFFYSTGLFSIAGDGNLMTNRRVISYEERDGDLIISAAPFDRIENLVVDQKGGWSSPTVLRVETVDGDSFLLYLSAENRGEASSCSDRFFPLGIHCTSQYPAS
jgi:hypothetical protein